MMAALSNAVNPLSLIAGTLPVGLSFKNSGVFCSPASKLTCLYSYLSPIALAAKRTLLAGEEKSNPKIVNILASFYICLPNYLLKTFTCPLLFLSRRLNQDLPGILTL